jgi:ribonuclease HI
MSNMSAKKQKYYVVWVGATPGIYTSWAECQLQIKGYPAAKYKAFPTIEEAKSAYAGKYSDVISPAKAKKNIGHNTLNDKKGILWKSLSVDAACSGSPGIMEYRGVWTDSKDEIFHQGPFPYGTNNIGEFLALVHGIAYLQKKGLTDLPVYSDSRTALSWLKNKKVKTTLVKNHKTEILHDLVERALHWLNTNTYKNPILKWKTEAWGEIPADFGRK